MAAEEVAKKRRGDPALRLREQEQRLAYVLAAFPLIFFAINWKPWQGVANLLGFVIGSVLMGALALTARRGHRLWTAFAAFINGFNPAWGYFYILGSFHIAFAFWIGWKAHRTIKASLNADPTKPRATPMAGPRKAPAIESGRVTPKGTAKRRPPKAGPRGKSGGAGRS